MDCVSHSEQDGIWQNENTLLTVWKENVFTDLTDPKWEVAENGTCMGNNFPEATGSDRKVVKLTEKQSIKNYEDTL